MDWLTTTAIFLITVFVVQVINTLRIYILNIKHDNLRKEVEALKDVVHGTNVNQRS